MADGLLDFLKTPEGQGLLAATFGGLAGARQGQPLNSIGRAGLAGLSGYGGALERQSTMQQQMEAKRLRDLQVQQMQSALNQQQEAAAQKQRDQQLYGQLTKPQGEAAATIDDFGRPVITSAPIQPRFDPLSALRRNMSPEAIEKYSKIEQMNRPEIARQVEIEGPQGQKLLQSFDKYGQPVGSPMPAYMAPVQVDTGRSVQFVKPQAGAQISKQPSFGDEVAMGNLGVSRQRLEFDKSKEGKPVFNAEAGGWVIPPSKDNPQGALIPMSGNGPLKPPTEGQAKAVLFGARIASANQTFDELEKQGYVTPSYTKSAAESIPLIGGALGRAASASPLVSAQEQQLEQAQRDFVNAVLRRESGAVIADSEFDNAKKQYFPQFGDSDAVIAQKRRNREVAMRGITYEAGAHAKAIPQIIGNRSAMSGGGWSATPMN